MKHTIISLLISLLVFSARAESVEHGSVKEYRGAEAKVPLAGVELNVKGAQSTVSDKDGNFSLRFAILDPGQKVDYTDIYKQGYVIFNKDAIEAWRISNDGTPFTIIMCKEGDFRALKKKFYGIIERSYLSDYQRQKELAEQTIADKNKLETQLKQLKADYEAKMGNINTYVELFSRIDRSEMDSIEARALEFVEVGKIDKAIQIYEELQLDRQIENQLTKWDSGEEMRAAAEKMISQSQADLVILAAKMQKQIGLYEMGGAGYKEKRLDMITKLIPLLYRINPAANYRYNEDIGRLIVERAKGRPWGERLADYREAAAVPSAHGCLALAERYSFSLINDKSLSDSIAYYNRRGLELSEPGDSIHKKLTKQAGYIPDGVFDAPDGKKYPFKRRGKYEAALCGYSYYVSTPLDKEATLPSWIVDGKDKLKVTEIGEHAFGDNPSLKKVVLPKFIRMVDWHAFGNCPVDTFMAPHTLCEFDEADNTTAAFIFTEIPDSIEWLADRVDEISDMKHPLYAQSMLSLLQTHIDYAEKHKNKPLGAVVCNQMAYVYAMDSYGIGDLGKAKELANKAIKFAGKDKELLANVYDSMGEFYLMEGNEQEARLWHDKSAALVKGFYENTPSVLHNHFYPVQIDSTKYTDNNVQADSMMRFCAAIALASAEYAAGRMPADNKLGYRDLRWYALKWLENMNKYTPTSIIEAGSTAITLSCQISLRNEVMCNGHNFDPAWNGWYVEGDSIRIDRAVCDSIAAMAQRKAPIEYRDEIDEIAQNGFKREGTNVQKYINIVQDVSRLADKRFFVPNFRNADYEELLSIGIIAVQVMIKNKTPEELKKYDSMYIATAISWAIYNELRIRYGWFADMTSKFDEVTPEEAAECERAGIDAKQLAVRLAIYDVVRQIYNGVKSGKLPRQRDANVPSHFDEFAAFIGKVESVKPTLSPEAAAFATELFDASTTNESLKKNHSLAEINACLDEIRTALNKNGERAY